MQISLLSGAILAAVLILEMLLRLYPIRLPVSRLEGHTMHLPKSTTYELRSAQPIADVDAVVHIRKNSLGLRGPEPRQPATDTPKIIAMGGSTTECLYLSEGDTWTDQLDSLLSGAGFSIWMNNAGIDGHSTFGHQIVWDQIVAPIRPSLVLLFVGANDVARDAESYFDRNANVLPPDTVERFLAALGRISKLGEVLQVWYAGRPAVRQGVYTENAVQVTQLDTITRMPADIDREVRYYEVSRQAYKNRLKHLIQSVLDVGAVPVLITQPALYGTGTDDQTKVNLGAIALPLQDTTGIVVNGEMQWALLESYNDITRTVGADAGVTVIDVAGSLTKSTRWFYDYLHFTKSGAREMARIIAPDICRILKQQYPQQYKSISCQFN